MNRRTSTLGAALVTLLVTLASNAQEPMQPTALGQAVQQGGGTSLQITTANRVQMVCGNLASEGFSQIANAIRLPNTPQEDLYFRCNEMVHTANQLLNSGGTGNSLGLSGEDLARAMQQLAGEESASKGRLATETSNGQFANIGLRLDAIARGARATTGALTTAGRELGSGMTGGNAGDDAGEGGGWGWFLTGAHGFGDREASSRENEYEYNSAGLTFGADYQLPNGVVLGAALGYASFEVDFEDLSAGRLAGSAAGGGIDVDGYSLNLFGLAQLGRFTLDGVVIYGNNDYETERVVKYLADDDASGRADGLVVNRTMLGTTDSNQWAAGLNIGTSFSRRATTLYLDAGMTFLDIDIDGYAETDPTPHGGLGLAFGDQAITSRQSRLGLHLTHAFSTRSGVIAPFIQAEWRHEYENGAELRLARYVNAASTDPNLDLVFETDPPDEDFVQFGAGLVFVLRNNFQLVFDYRRSASLAFVDANLLTFSFRGGL